jgi:metallopeptidase family M12-like protein
MRRSTGDAARDLYTVARTLLVLASALAFSAMPDRAAVGQGAKGDGRSELVLTNLPPRGSKAYKDLLGLAGKEANGQVLGFTQSEMWSMPSSRIEGVIRQGEALGVKMTRLSADWNHILRPPSAPMQMSRTQETMLKGMEGSKETMRVGMMASPNAAVVEYALMKDHDPKSAIGNRPAALISKIVIPINDKESITVRRTNVDMRKDGCTWRGEIEGTGEPIMIMWWKSGRFSGLFTYRGRMYTLRSMGGEVHAVVETDPGKMPPDHGSMPAQGAAPPQGADVKEDPLVSRGEGAMMRPRDRSNLEDRKDSIGGVAPQTAVTSDNTAQPKIVPLAAVKRRAMGTKKITIDLMVLYTSKVVSKYIDIDNDLIALAIEQANGAFTNSGLGNIKLRLVHRESIDYDESDGEHFNHLYQMVDGVGAFSRVRALRNEKRADVVALIVDDPSGCGLSTRVGAGADEAFVVVHHSCAALTYSIAHEVGHIIGARHDISLDKNVTPFPYGHGYVNGTKWRDIMSYKASCDGCPRVPIWSNPTIKFRGDPAGTIDADNARVILEQAERVSKFR